MLQKSSAHTLLKPDMPTPHREVVASVIGVQRERQQVVRRIVEGVPGAQHLTAARDEDAVDQLEPAAHVFQQRKGLACPSLGAQAYAFIQQKSRTHSALETGSVTELRQHDTVMRSG